MSRKLQRFETSEEATSSMRDALPCTTVSVGDIPTLVKTSNDKGWTHKSLKPKSISNEPNTQTCPSEQDSHMTHFSSGT